MIRFLCFTLLLFVNSGLTLDDDLASSFAFVVNGHKYNAETDFVQRILQERYADTINDSGMALALDSLAQSFNLSLVDYSFPDSVNILYLLDSSGYYDFAIKIIIDSVTLNMCGYDCEFTVRIAGMGFDLSVAGECINAEYRVSRQQIKIPDPFIDLSERGSGHCGVLADYIKVGLSDRIADFLKNWVDDLVSPEQMFVSLNPIAALGITDSSLIARALQGFPIDLELYTSYDPLQDGVQFIEKVDFLSGTADDPHAFVRLEPPALCDHGFNRTGFSFLYWGLEQGFAWHLDWNKHQRVDAAFEIMNRYDLRDYRIDARWRQLQKQVIRGRDLHPDQLNEADLDSIFSNSDYFDQNAVAGLKSILENGYKRGLSPFMAVGTGHQDAVPLDATGAIIAPATFGWTAPAGYVGISADEYLYNLKIYAHAVVKTFASDIDVWQIENELNAAGWAAMLPQWWRKGDLWSTLEFRNRVWSVLVQAVHKHDPTARIMHDFHMLELIEHLEKWIDDLDIVGINFYPNYSSALPVLGFVVGEYVWAVRRALTGLGNPHKPVWVVETAYPAIYEQAPLHPLSLQQDMFVFTENRQSQYIKDAVSTAADNGAKAFFYFSLTSPQDSINRATALNRYMMYCGLVRHHSDAEKRGLETFAQMCQRFTDNTEVINQLKRDRPVIDACCNYPNPFNGITTIHYDLTRGGKVTISVYNCLGQRMAVLLDAVQPRGHHFVRWNATSCPSGLYVCRIELDGIQIAGKKLLYLR